MTDTYILADLDAVRDAVNRAAFSIDGSMLPGVVQFEPKMADGKVPRRWVLGAIVKDGSR